MYWETIRAACAERFERFDFGRSSRDSGTYRFKRQWGAVDSPLYWYTVPIGRGQVPPRSNGVSRTAACLAGLWQFLPLTVTRHVGPHVRKYLIQ
jgi:hypothetical protein